MCYNFTKIYQGKQITTQSSINRLIAFRGKVDVFIKKVLKMLFCAFESMKKNQTDSRKYQKK